MVRLRQGSTPLCGFGTSRTPATRPQPRRALGQAGKTRAAVSRPGVAPDLPFLLNSPKLPEELTDAAGRKTVRELEPVSVMPPPSLLDLRRLRCFLLLSVADLLLTAHLLRGGDARFHEVNPLAAWCLARCGWLGLGAFKAATVLLATGALVVLARRRPGAARVALSAGCAAVGLVVVYSVSLAAVVGPHLRRQERRELEVQAEQDRVLEARCRKAHAYGRLLNRLSREVADGRPLAEAAHELAALGRHHDADWQRFMGQLYPGKSPREMLTAHLSWSAGKEGARPAPRGDDRGEDVARPSHPQ